MPRNLLITGHFKETGNVLLSHGRVTIVPSTSVDLTSVFGMGTGVTPPVKLPEKSSCLDSRFRKNDIIPFRNDTRKFLTIMKYRVTENCRSKLKMIKHLAD